MAKPGSPRRTLIILGVAAAALLLAGLGGVLWFMHAVGRGLETVDVNNYVAAERQAMARRARTALDRAHAVPVTADKLAADYAADRAAADAAYRGKTLEVTGTIELLYRPSMERVSLVLAGDVGCELVWDINDPDPAKKARIKKGERITVLGHHAGCAGSGPRCFVELEACVTAPSATSQPATRPASLPASAAASRQSEGR